MLFWSTIKLPAPHLLRLFSFRDTTNPLNLLHTKQMPRLTGKALADDIANTVVEDSEPERQAEEVIWKEQRRKRREDNPRKNEQAIPKVGEVAADSEQADLAKPSPPKHVDPSVIEISDTTVGSSEALSANASMQDQMPSPSSENEVQDLLVQSTRAPSASHFDFIAQDNAPIDLTACISFPAEPEPLTSKLDIARFAFVKKAGPSTVPRAVASLSRQYSSTSTSEEDSPVVKPPISAKSAAALPSFASFFTEYQLTALSKCIVCNLAWTVRKTVPVKITHIKSCARKNGWNEGTIIKALTTEIGHTPTSTDVVKGSKKGKGKGKAVAVQPHKTLLEDVVNEAAPKKKRKKVQDEGVVTVLNPQDAHAAILKRAKSLLGPPTRSSSAPHDEVDTFPATQIFAPSHLGASGTRGGVLGQGMFEDQTAPVATWSTPSIMDTEHNVLQADVDKLPPSTQTSRHSALAGKSSIKRSVLYDNEDDSGEQLGNDTARMLPPMTQAFRQSGLAKFGQTRQSLLDSNGTSTSTFPPAIDNPIADQIQARPLKPFNSNTKPLLAVTRPPMFHGVGTPSISSSSNDELVHLPKTSQRKLLDLDRRLAGINMGFQEGTVQLDPQPKISYGSVFGRTIEELSRADHEGVVGNKYKGNQKARSCSSSSSRSRSRSKSRSRKPSSRGKNRSPPKNRRALEGECVDDNLSETLDEDLHRIIKENKVLYERILRYEPIHFDIFLKLAGIQEMDSRKHRLKFKLRTFLDKQAINFYGDSALANRRRYR